MVLEVKKQMQISLIAIILVVISSIIGAVGGFVFNRVSQNLTFKLSRLLRNYKLVLGFFLFGLSAIIYIIALKKGDLNIIYPLSSLTYVWSTLLAKKYLNESINIHKWSGILLIILGTILIVR